LKLNSNSNLNLEEKKKENRKKYKEKNKILHGPSNFTSGPLPFSPRAPSPNRSACHLHVGPICHSLHPPLVAPAARTQSLISPPRELQLAAPVFRCLWALPRLVVSLARIPLSGRRHEANQTANTNRSTPWDRLGGFVACPRASTGRQLSPCMSCLRVLLAYHLCGRAVARVGEREMRRCPA
jgi:hypothetical protein